jgi:hypothetical protein
MRIALLAFASCFMVAGAVAQNIQNPTEDMIQFYSDPNEFYLFDETSVKVLDYNSERDVRICAETRRHGIALQVDYDDKSTVVRPGDCFEFEAMTVSIEPAESLPPNLDLTGTIQTRNR